jgi:ubiquinone/menaquinone biosynthesis C-methylase UbiE
VIDLREDSLELMRCPLCHGELVLDVEETQGEEVSSGLLDCSVCKKEYKIRDGIPDFVLPELLNETDEKWMRSYDRTARSYELMMGTLIPLLSMGSEPLERRRWIRQLQVRPGDHVLDVSTGTGRNLSFIAKHVCSKGKISAMDISQGALSYAKMKITKKKWKNVELQRANASYLPFKNDTFSAVLHVGGINTFGEKRRALCEMVRVAKPNAKIVIVDEGLAPGQEKSFVGRLLLRTNALYSCKPPTGLLPENVKHLQLRWKIICGRFLPIWPFYNMEFRKCL